MSYRFRLMLDSHVDLPATTGGHLQDQAQVVLGTPQPVVDHVPNVDLNPTGPLQQQFNLENATGCVTSCDQISYLGGRLLRQEGPVPLLGVLSNVIDVDPGVIVVGHGSCGQMNPQSGPASRKSGT